MNCSIVTNLTRVTFHSKKNETISYNHKRFLVKRTFLQDKIISSDDKHFNESKKFLQTLDIYIEQEQSEGTITYHGTWNIL